VKEVLRVSLTDGLPGRTCVSLKHCTRLDSGTHWIDMMSDVER
jgi:hypothetical protein